MVCGLILDSLTTRTGRIITCEPASVPFVRPACSWEYVKAHNLQSAAQKSLITPDGDLAAVFGSSETVKHTSILKLIQPHIHKEALA